MSRMVNQAKLDPKEIENLDTTPQHEHKKRLVEEEKQRKATSLVVDQYIKVMPDYQHKKGGKVRLFKRMKNGNVHSIYLGRYSQVKDLLPAYKEKGVKIIP